MPPRFRLLIATFAGALRRSPRRRRTRRPTSAGFDAANPGAPGYDWSGLGVTRRIDYRFTWQPAAGGALRISDARRVTPPPRARRQPRGH